MFLRLVVLSRNGDSGCLEGVFQVTYRLRDQGRLDQAGTLLQWFSLHLPVPPRFALSRGRHSNRQAICWFKGEATRHLDKVWELARLLQQHGIPFRKLTTNRPGYLVYEDAFQVAAVPFRDTSVQLSR